MPTSNRYLKRYKVTALVGALLYGIIAGATLLTARTGAQTEIFPIFSWDLFSTVPNTRIDHVLVIDALDGRDLDTAAELSTLQDDAVHYSMYAHHLVQELAAAQAAGDSSRVEELDRALRENHLGGAGRAVEYHLERRSYDVLERFDQGGFRSSTQGVSP